MKNGKKLSFKIAGIAASMMMVSGVFAIAPAIADQGSILVIDETVTPTSSAQLREVAAKDIVKKINEKAGRTVISIDADAETNSAMIVVNNDYNLGENGESFTEINDVLEQYGFGSLEAIA